MSVDILRSIYECPRSFPEVKTRSTVRSLVSLLLTRHSPGPVPFYNDSAFPTDAYHKTDLDAVQLQWLAIIYAQ